MLGTEKTPGTSGDKDAGSDTPFRQAMKEVARSLKEALERAVRGPDGDGKGGAPTEDSRFRESMKEVTGSLQKMLDRIQGRQSGNGNGDVPAEDSDFRVTMKEVTRGLVEGLERASGVSSGDKKGSSPDEESQFRKSMKEVSSSLAEMLDRAVNGRGAEKPGSPLEPAPRSPAGDEKGRSQEELSNFRSTMREVASSIQERLERALSSPSGSEETQRPDASGPWINRLMNDIRDGGGAVKREARPQQNLEVLSERARLAIQKFEGTGVNRQPYNNDGALGKRELRQAGIHDATVSRLLRRGLGNGDGFLDQKELVAAQRRGLITISEDGKISLTASGKAWNGEPAKRSIVPPMIAMNPFDPFKLDPGHSPGRLGDRQASGAFAGPVGQPGAQKPVPETRDSEEEKKPKVNKV